MEQFEQVEALKAELWRRREGFRLIVDSVKDYAIFLLDPKGIVKTWNKGAKLINQYDGHEIIGKHFSIFYPPEDAKAKKPDWELEEALRVGKYQEEGWRLRKDGTRFWASVTITPIRDETGNLIGFVKVSRDLTEKKNLEDELREARDKLAESLERTQESLKLALESAEMGIFDWDVKNNKIIWSEILLKLWGYKEGEFSGKVDQIRERVHPDDLAYFEKQIYGSLNQGRPYEAEYRIILPDSTIHWISAKGRPILDAQGKTVRFLGTAVEVTERKEAEERERVLAEASLNYSSSLDYEKTLKANVPLLSKIFSGSITVYLVERDGPRHLLAYRHGKVFEKEIDKDSNSLAVRSIKEKRAIQGHTSNHRPVIAVPMMVHGKILGSIEYILEKNAHSFTKEEIAFVEEFTRRTALAIDNAKLYQTAQNAVRVREDVISIVSHDLKNPLSSILLTCSLLRRMAAKGEGDQKFNGQIERITKAAERMKVLIVNLLDVTRIEANTFTIEPHPEDVQTLLTEAVELHRPMAQEKSIKLTSDIGPGCCPIYCDYSRTMQVLSNLIGNALKFTPTGGSIQLQVEISDHEAQFSIKDSGPGIPTEQLPHIFDRFWQAKGAKKMGAGLGLFIAKGIVEAHEGRIWVESRPGEGATFFFTLPLTY